MIIYAASVMMMTGIQKNIHFPICITRTEPYSLIQKVNAFQVIEQMVINHTHYDEGNTSVAVTVLDNDDGDTESHVLYF
jgi:hypothetical protein